MTDPQDHDVQMEDDYDEEADSDFDAASVQSADSASSSEVEEEADSQANSRAKKRRRVDQTPLVPEPLELDSGDEATIKEQKKTRKKQIKKGEDVPDEEGDDSQGWRARTRAMRERDKEERKQNKLASIQGSTIDVDRLWEEMNRPDAPTPVPVSVPQTDDTESAQNDPTTADKEHIQSYKPEMITIKRTYKFAGEVHTEEKSVLKDSAEAKLWLAQQPTKALAVDAEGKTIHRPLRKVSRFDPNFSNLAAFHGNWTSAQKAATGPKLNVVEKSKMDWAVHVDAEGLQAELTEHARAKDSYLSRDDFLRSVSQRQDAEARAARLRGK